MSFDELMFSGGSGITHKKNNKSGGNQKINKLKTLPALAFVVPYHEMLMQHLLWMGNCDGVKTRKSRWNYRGPVLLYTSKGRYHRAPVKAYNLDPNKLPTSAIVGVATVIDSRELTWNERVQITANFNKVHPNRAEEMLLGTDGDYVTAMLFGVFLQDIKRFKKPVTFKPRPGAIGIMRVPLKQVAKALREVGVDSKNL